MEYDKAGEVGNGGEEKGDRENGPKEGKGGKPGAGKLPPDFKPGKDFNPEKPNKIPWLGKGRKGYPDKKGNYWEPTKGHAHGEPPHWDVQHPDGTQAKLIGPFPFNPM